MSKIIEPSPDLSPRCCQPYWFYDFYHLATNGLCGFCREKILSSHKAAISLAICCFVKCRVHYVTLTFHVDDETPSECGPKFMEQFFKAGWDLFARYLPLSAPRITPEINEMIAYQCCALYNGGNVSCKWCKIWEPKGKKFQVCSGCRKVRYCSPMCQKLGWSDHRLDCRLLSGIATEAEKEEARKSGKLLPIVSSSPGPMPEYIQCDCYDDNDLIYHNAWMQKKCANPNCNQALTDTVAIPLAFHVTQCNKSAIHHIIPYWFCSAACERRTASQYKKVME